MLQQKRNSAGTEFRELHDLTARELEVAKALANGLSYAEIGEELGIRFNTVASHIKSILSKLQVKSSRRAAAMIRDALGREGDP